MKTLVHTARLYTSIHKLPLSKFIDVFCDKDYSQLIIEGEPTELEIQSAWAEIMEQFMEASAGSEHKRYIKLCAEIARLELMYNMAVMLINQLRVCYVERFATRLNNLLTTAFVFDIRDLEKYDDILDKCFSRAKNFKLTLELKTGQLQAMNESFAATKHVPKREDFSKTLISLSDYAGRELFEDQLTVYTYCERLKRYIAHIDNQKNIKK